MVYVHPLLGFYAAFMMALIVVVLDGWLGMISGAAGAMTVVVVALVVQHGIVYLFAAMVLMGILQMPFDVPQLGKLVRLAPYPVFLGFVNGLAIVIFSGTA